MSGNELAGKVRQLRELQQLIEEAETEAETIKDLLKAEMAARATDEMNVDVFKVRWNVVKSTRFDTKAFQSTHKELYNQYCKQTENRRFTVA